MVDKIFKNFRINLEYLKNNLNYKLYRKVITKKNLNKKVMKNKTNSKTFPSILNNNMSMINNIRLLIKQKLYQTMKKIVINKLKILTYQNINFGNEL